MLAETRLHGRAVDCLQHKSVSRISSHWWASWPRCLFLGVHAWLMLFNTDFFHLGKAVFTSCGQLIAFWISCSLGRAVTVLLAARCSNMNCLLRMLFQWNIPSYCNWLVMPTVQWSTTHFHLVKARFFSQGNVSSGLYCHSTLKVSSSSWANKQKPVLVLFCWYPRP